MNTCFPFPLAPARPSRLYSVCFVRVRTCQTPAHGGRITMANNITPEVLIPLVEQRAVLWDKTLDIYKDKGLKLAAWREICCVFEPNFDKLEEKERKDFGKFLKLFIYYDTCAVMFCQGTEPISDTK